MRMTIQIWCILLIAVGLFFSASGAWAMPESAYFLQDDFVLTFNQPTDPPAAGAVLQISFNPNTSVPGGPRVVYWDHDQKAAWFSLSATASGPAAVANGIATIHFDNGTFTINSESDGSGNNLWTGSIDSFSIQYYTDFTTHFPSSVYDRPDYPNARQWSSYDIVGCGVFNKTGGTWSDSKLVMDWVGGSQMNQGEDGVYYGNLEGKLVTPEPGSAAALLCGLTGLSGFVLKRRG